nr:hypothetical protein [Bacteroidales bacterium]
KIEEISKGLYEGAKLANINIPGGEIAQVKEILHDGENSFDMFGQRLSSYNKYNNFLRNNLFIK